MLGIFSAKPTIYLEIADTMLIVATLRYKQGAYQFNNLQTHPLTLLEVINGVIFNPTAIFSIISQLLPSITARVSGCKTVLAIPGIARNQNTPEHCIALQAALCAAKAGLVIEHVVSISLYQPDQKTILKKLPNLLQPFQTRTRSCLPLGAAGGLLFLTGTSFYCFDQTKHITLQTQILTTQCQKLTEQENRTQDLKQKITDTQRQTEQLQITIKSIKNFHERHTTYAPLLKSIADHIPDQLILTALELGRRRKQSTSQKGHALKKKQTLTEQQSQSILIPLTLKGLSFDADNIIAFNKALSSLKQFKNVKLTMIKKLKRSEQKAARQNHSFRYAFSLQAMTISS